jgi:serine/threonine protein kinase
VNEITPVAQPQYSTYQPQPGSVVPAPAGGRSGFFIKYDLREEVGLGSTSKCFKCTRKSDGQEFACKVIDKRQVEVKFSGLLDQFFVEIKVLKTLNHPNIIHLEDTFETPDRIYMVMEMMSGGELFDYVVEKGTLSEEEASIIVRKITSAVAHMHGLGIIHRDLKPENLVSLSFWLKRLH